MKNYIKFLKISVLALVIELLMSGCVAKPTTLSAPENVKIDVTGRTMTVTWDAVNNASGYQIITDSEGCGSGKKKINTKEMTAVVNNPEAANNGSNALKNDKSSGAVEILGTTKIQITLMPNRENQDIPMAMAVTAKVMSLGGNTLRKKIIDSDYSNETKKVLSAGSM